MHLFCIFIFLHLDLLHTVCTHSILTSRHVNKFFLHCWLNHFHVKNKMVFNELIFASDQLFVVFVNVLIAEVNNRERTAKQTNRCLLLVVRPFFSVFDCQHVSLFKTHFMYCYNIVTDLGQTKRNRLTVSMSGGSREMV